MIRIGSSVIVAITVFVLGHSCQAFAPNAVPHSTVKSLSKTSLNLGDTSIFSDPDSARRLFYFWFGGTSGGGGIAVAAFPQMFSRFQKIQELKGIGPTLGGEKLGMSTLLCGLPEDISKADVEKIVNNKMSTEKMVAKGPQDSYFAQKGYLRFEAFEQANPKCNPLALRAVFDAFTTSSATVDPREAQILLDSFRQDTSIINKALISNKLKGYSAIGTLLLLLGIALSTCGDAFSHGWFPDWPGNQNFPIGLVSPGFWTIPQYWT